MEILIRHRGRCAVAYLLAASVVFMLSACTPAPPSVQANTLPKQKINGVILTTLTAPAGWQLKETKGLYCQFFQYAGTGDYVDKFRAVVEGIAAEGQKQGVNAFVNARISSESHEVQGSKWHASVVQICGDFAVLE